MAKKNLPVSPLAPAETIVLPPVPGVELAIGATGTRYKGRPDLLLMRFAEGTTVAGVLTTSSMPGAPVEWCRKVLPGGAARALTVNAGCANVFTGKAGREAVQGMARTAAKVLACKPEEVLQASTGVIGMIMPWREIAATLATLPAQLAADRWAAAAEAIRTTDTFAKTATATARIDGVKVTINGICKGSGMIAPDMATMLAFVATDARLPAPVLRKLLQDATAQSFNCLTVDSDMSTSDTLLLFATGQAPHQPVRTAADARLKDFRRALNQVTATLAQLVARDGEGAQKLITVDVTGAASDAAARRIALSIANAPLVKTAIAGGDANWGRIVMAVGKSGEKADRDRLVVTLGGQKVTSRGMVRPDYQEALAAEHLKGREVAIGVDVGVGGGKARVWTCDLTHGYIDINADYRS